MSRTVALAALLLALGAGALAWWLIVSQRGAGEGPRTLLRFAPADISELRVVSGERVHRVVRTDSIDWALLAPEGSGALSWPVATPTVRAALDILADLRYEPADAPGEDGVESVSATLIGPGGATRTLTLHGRPIGGRALATSVSGDGAAPRAGFIDAGVREMLISPGPAGWREKVAMPGVGVEVSRVRIVTPEQTLLLGQVAGAWTLREPVVARASATAVDAVLGTITSLKVERFIDDGSVDAESAGLLDPALVVIAETDVRRVAGEDVVVSTMTRRLDIGAAADIEGAALFATPDGGATIFTIAANALRVLPREPIACIARTATGVLPSNVGMLHVRFADGSERGYRRGLDGWSELRPDGSLAPIDEQPALDAIDFLATRLPPDLRLTDEQEATDTRWAVVTLFDFADRPLDEVTLVESGGSPAAIAGRVLRVYTGGQWPELLTPERAAP